MRSLAWAVIWCGALAAQDGRDWTTYWGDYAGTRHRPLSQIDTANVKNLRVEWIFQTGVPGRFETVPLIVDGIMYFTATSVRYLFSPIKKLGTRYLSASAPISSC